MSNTKDSIISLDQEITERKIEDNNIHVKISNESIKRAENDAICRIKIAEESGKRAEENSKLSIRISESEVKDSDENNKLHLKILELEDKINKLSFQEKKQEPKKDEPKKEEIVETNQIPTVEMSHNRLNDFENEIVNQNTNAVMEVISKLANTLPPECNKDFLTNIAFNLAKDIGNLSIDSVNTFRNQDSSSESNIINDDNNNSHQNELNKITKEVNIIIDKESNKN